MLAELARKRKDTPDAAYQWFRMPIDRAFNITGRGTVVTRSVAHGAVRAEDTLEFWPEGRRVRVRDLQTHLEGITGATGRMRRIALARPGRERSRTQRGSVGL